MPTDRPTEEQVKEWLRLSEKATPGDWTGRIGLGGCDYIVKAERSSDQRFIVAARTAVPALCHALLEAWAANQCDACCGAGEALGGWPCMCGGSGRMSDAALHLREQLVAAEARADAAEKRADEGRKLLNELHGWFSDYIRFGQQPERSMDDWVRLLAAALPTPESEPEPNMPETPAEGD